MGYKIVVEHSKFSSAAKAIDDYVDSMKNRMRNADNAVNTMCNSWVGNDAAEFKKKWNTVKNDSSAYGKMKKSLESYSRFLKDADAVYKKAQNDAQSRARSLPRW